MKISKNVVWGLCALMCLTHLSCAEKKTNRPDSVNVKTMKVATSSQVIGKSYLGTIEEEDGANVTFNTIGTIVKVMVDEGQFVKKHQALAEVDGSTTRNAYQISSATLHQTEDAYRRLKDLYDKGTLPEIKMVEMEAALAKARAAEAISRKGLEDITLRAPFEGYIAQCSAHEGANVTPGITGFKLVKIDRVKVGISIPEKDIGQIRNGQPVTFIVNALGDSIYHAKIVNRGVSANPINHSYKVTALTDNSRHQLLPGMVCKVMIENTSDDYSIVIPQQAIMISGQDRYVWTVREGKAHRQNVMTGDILAGGVVITSGLTSGETIIIAGQNKVSEGTIVRSEN